MKYTGHPYWERYLEEPIVQVYVLSTNEPWLDEVLDSLTRQDHSNYKVWLVLDCPEKTRLELVTKYLYDHNVTLVLSPFLGGLTRSVNMALKDTLGKYLFVTGAEYVYPPDTISTFVRIAEKHPEYVLGPNLQVPGFSRFGPSWSYFMCRSKIRPIGLWDEAFGPGGVGSAHDWMIQAWLDGWKFKAVQDIKVKYRPYSIQDKISDWSIVEGREEWAKRYGGDLMAPASVVPGFKGWEWIDRDGNPC